MDLPKDAFLQWVSWVMSPRYLFDDPEARRLQNFPNYKGALRALCMSDDPWATRPAVELLCAGFTSIKPEIITVTPADTGAGKIGPFGFFRPEHRDTLWRGAAEWIEAGYRRPAARYCPRHTANRDGIAKRTIAQLSFIAMALDLDCPLRSQ